MNLLQKRKNTLATASTSNSGKLLRFIHDCMTAALFFAVVDILYIVGMFAISPGVFVQLKNLTYSLKTRYTIFMFDETKNKLLLKNAAKDEKSDVDTALDKGAWKRDAALTKEDSAAENV
jgi:hypothetical protein